MSEEKPSYNRKQHWIVDAAELAFILAFLAWLETVLQDWLFSSVDPYPYRDSTITSFGVFAGFACFLRVRRLDLWRDTLLAGATILTGADIFGFVPSDWGVAPAVALLAGGLAVPPLLMRDENRHRLRRGLCLIAILVALASIASFAGAFADWAKALRIGFVASGISGLAILVAHLSRERSVRHTATVVVRIASIVLLSASVLLLIYQTFAPTLARFTTDTDALLGRGFGSYPGEAPETYSFAAELAEAQGLSAAFVLCLVMVAALAAGVVALARASEGSERQIRVQLCAGSLGAMAGMMMSAGLKAPFLTPLSLAGTWALALTIASLGLSASRFREGQGAASLSTSTPKPLSGQRPKSVRILGATGTAFLIIAIWVVAYAGALRAMIEPFAGTSAPPGYQGYVSLSNISVAMRDATVAMEDRHFYEHHGFDWEAIHRALRVNLRAGRVRQGGSTITQQLVKNLFLTQERTVGRKVKEAALTLQTERMLAKPRILELYLNTIDYGMGQKGIKAAANYYFHKAPGRLTLAESAILVSLVSQPPQDGLSMRKLWRGRETALQRVAGLKLGRYSEADIAKARDLPLDRLIYPYKNAWDRGATDEIPAVWRGVGFFYSALNDDDPRLVTNVAPVLKRRLEKFLKEAQRRYEIVGIDHIGVYNDRLMRDSESVLSAHTFGQAIDISGFRFANGSRVRVKDHASAHAMLRLAPLQVLLKKHFDVVVDWRNDPERHNDHFHAEVMGNRSLKPREPVLDDPLP